MLPAPTRPRRFEARMSQHCIQALIPPVNRPLRAGEIELVSADRSAVILNQNVDLAEEAGDDLVIRAKKAEEITISFGSSSINYRIPMKLWVKKIVPITFLELEVEGTIAISMSTKFKIGEDWKLESSLT